MTPRLAADKRLSTLTKVCLALPETTRQDQKSHIAFLVRNKIFAYFLYDNHTDGIMAVACKALPDDNTVLVAAQPDRFFLPAYIGPRGWVALRLDRGHVDWEEVGEFVRGSYGLVAPKSLRSSVS
jgi:phosphoribosylglycinamide formyltransferase-1